MLPLLEMVMGDGGKKFLGYAAEIYPQIDVPTLMMMFGDRNRLDRLWHAFLTEYDVLLLPTWAHPPFELGADIASLDGALATLDTLRPVRAGQPVRHPRRGRARGHGRRDAGRCTAGRPALRRPHRAPPRPRRSNSTSARSRPSTRSGDSRRAETRRFRPSAACCFAQR